jgi:hypothetical protein
MDKQQQIEKNLANLESMAYAILDHCQQTRKLLEADVSTPTDDNSSEIAKEARRILRKKLLVNHK